MEHKAAFVDVRAEHEVTERGQRRVVPERWAVNEDEKGNLCEWLCENGTAVDFRHFDRIRQELSDIPGVIRVEVNENDDDGEGVGEEVIVGEPSESDGTGSGR